MRRVTLSLVAALTVAAIALPVVARVEGACGSGPGWERQPANAATLIALYPSLQRAADDGVVTADDLAGQLDARDKNDNGWVCVKDPYAHSTTQSGGANAQSQGFFYFVNAVDDNAAPK